MSFVLSMEEEKSSETLKSVLSSHSVLRLPQVLSNLVYGYAFDLKTWLTDCSDCQEIHSLVQEGKIRGWGLCNDNAFGLTACSRTAKSLGTTPPCTVSFYVGFISHSVAGTFHF